MFKTITFLEGETDNFDKKQQKTFKARAIPETREHMFRCMLQTIPGNRTTEIEFLKQVSANGRYFSACSKDQKIRLQKIVQAVMQPLHGTIGLSRIVIANWGQVEIL